MQGVDSRCSCAVPEVGAGGRVGGLMYILSEHLRVFYFGEALSKA
jgi:hypothetical protein